MTRKIMREMAVEFAEGKGTNLNEEGPNDFRDKEKLSRFINSFHELL